MTHKIPLDKLKGIPSTLLLPLRGRCLETRRYDGIIYDPKSVEIADSLDHDFSLEDVPWDGQVMLAVRTEILDEATRAFLDRHPDGIVVNLGCGLDTRVHRMDNGRVTWYDLDLAECIDIRRYFFEESARHRFISKSVLDFSWMDDIERGRQTLFIAEGLLMYFREADVRRILLAIKEQFPNSEILFEAYSRLMKICSWHRFHRRRQRHIKEAFSMFKWGLWSARGMERWSRGIRLLKEWHYLDRHHRRWGWLRHLRLIRPLRTGMRIVHLHLQPALN